MSDKTRKAIAARLARLAEANKAKLKPAPKAPKKDTGGADGK